MGCRMTTKTRIYKLLPQQIVPFWEAIKFTCAKADEVRTEEFEPYMNSLLHDLLSSKAQCFVRMDEDRRLVALCVTRIAVGRYSTAKLLDIITFYSWKAQPVEVVNRDLEFIRQFAEAEKCTAITFSSSNSRVWDITKDFGFTEVTRTFSFVL